MISNILIFLLGLSVVIGSSPKRYPFTVFFVFCGLMSFIDIFITPDYYSYYYLLSALIDLIIINQLSKITQASNTVILLQKSCLLFIGINFVGWLIYEAAFEPIIYDSLCAALFAIILIASENTRKPNVLGHNAIYSNIKFIFGSAYSRLLQIQRYGKAARS